MLAVSALHLMAARKTVRDDRRFALSEPDGDAAPWIVAGKIEDIEDKRAIIVSLPDEERVALGDEVAKVEQSPRPEGRLMTMVLAPR